MSDTMPPALAWREAAPANHFAIAYSAGSTFDDIWQTHAGGIGADLSGVAADMSNLTGFEYPDPDEDDIVGAWIALGN